MTTAPPARALAMPADPTTAREVAEARDLVRVMMHILRQMPVSLEDLDPRLDSDRLPDWVHGPITPAREPVYEWLAYCGPGDPNDPDVPGWVFDDEAEARDIAAHLVDGRLVVRELAPGPWVTVSLEPGAHVEAAGHE